MERRLCFLRDPDEALMAVFRERCTMEPLVTRADPPRLFFKTYWGRLPGLSDDGTGKVRRVFKEIRPGAWNVWSPEI